jgi:hypothetical protein
VFIHFRSLQFILSELHDYHNKQEQWLKHQEKLIWEQAPLDVRLLGQDRSSLSAILGSRGECYLINFVVNTEWADQRIAISMNNGSLEDVDTGCTKKKREVVNIKN